MSDKKFYVRIDAEEPEISTLAALSAVLRESGLDSAQQRKALQYLLDRRSIQEAPSADSIIADLSARPGLRAVGQ